MNDSQLQRSPGKEAHQGAWSRTLAALLLPLACCVLAGLPTTSQAFPPAPPHELFGTVRDAYGQPLADGAEILFEASSGVRIREFVIAQREPGVNFRLVVPLDAGLLAEPYAPTALKPAAPFKIRVLVSGVAYVPMEMVGNAAHVGAPGGRTRLDLTLGVDADGNGLPDAWEKAVADHLGTVWEPGRNRADDPYPGAGMTFREVYIAGTYAVNPGDGFALSILDASEQAPRLSFTAVRDRTYTVQSAERLGEWVDQAFFVSGAGASGTAQTSYRATETRKIEIRAVPLSEAPARFYRLLVE